jgi:hypothetical protein
MKRLTLAKETLFNLGAGAERVEAGAKATAGCTNIVNCKTKEVSCNHSTCPAHPCTVPTVTGCGGTDGKP